MNFNKIASDKWKALCKQMSKKHRDEYTLEVRFDDCLEFILGWPDANRTTQRSIQSGRETKYADIVLCDDESRPFLVVEMKKQGEEITSHERGQLLSYMRHQLVHFGMLVNEKLSLYYDAREPGCELEKVLSISFRDPQNVDGAKLSALLDKASFDLNALISFCLDYLAEKTKIEAEHGAIENIAYFKRTDPRKDELIRQLITLYANWYEQGTDYAQTIKQSRQWVTEHILQADLSRLSNEAFVERFRELARKITNQTRWILMRLNKEDEILEIRSEFEVAVSHLSDMSQAVRFCALGSFTGGAHTVHNLGRGFWSEMIRIRFPDVPLYNDKTQTFFDKIEVYIGETYEEKLMNISRFYKRFECPDMDFDKLSYLEHFVVAKNAKNEEGRVFMKENFPNFIEGET